MIVGKMVRVRLRRDFFEQRLWVFVGKALEFTENWIMIEGKGLTVWKRAQLEVEVENEPRIVVIPRDNVAIIRVLPDDFDMKNIRTVNKGHKLCLVVDGGPDATIAEVGEV
jgi:hypothetical protein